MKYTYTRKSQVLVGDKVYEKNDMIRIQGEHGTRFIFEGYVMNNETGKEWIDCYEVQKGQVAYRRSFNKNKIRPNKKPRLNVSSTNHDASAIREWAKSQSIQVSERGRISSKVVEAYEARDRD